MPANRWAHQTALVAGDGDLEQVESAPQAGDFVQQIQAMPPSRTLCSIGRGAQIATQLPPSHQPEFIPGTGRTPGDVTVRHQELLQLPDTSLSHASRQAVA